MSIVVLSMLFCSLLPALGATRRSVTPALKMEEPRNVHCKLTLRTLLLAGQVTFSTILLVTALLFVRNLATSQLTSPGFEVDRTMSAQFGFAVESGPARVGALLDYSRAEPFVVDGGRGVRRTVRAARRVGGSVVALRRGHKRAALGHPIGD